MNMWLLQQSVREAIEQAHNIGFKPSAEDRQKFEARMLSDEGQESSRIMSVAGNSADIHVTGVLTKSPDFFAMFFGGGNTTYSEINAAIALAENDDNIEKVHFLFDSGGGTVAGLFETIELMQKMEKPTTGIVVGTAASAAYALIAQCDSIKASNRASVVGSIGIAASITVREDEVVITSTNAPRKRPDVTTEAGKDMVREQLDEIHAIFVDAIVEGRGLTKEKVNADFGQGATFLAEKAISRGMIDAMVGTPTLRVVTPQKSTSASSGTQTETTAVDIKTLKTDHPSVYASVIALGIAQGVEQESERVKAHMIMGEACGDMSIAIDAIKEGTEMTPSVNAKYVAAGMNRADIEANQTDGDSTEVDEGADEEPAADEGDLVADALDGLLGINTKTGGA